MDLYDEVYRGKLDIEFTPEGIPLLICYSGDPWDISDEEADSQRRILPETTGKRHLCARIDADSTPAAHKPPVVHTLNPCSKVDTEPGSVSKCPAADTLPTKGSVLKRPRVDVNGEASQVLVRDLKPGQDSSAATTGTIEEVEGGSVLNKDLGGSSEIVVSNLNHGEDPIVDASSDT